MFPQLLYYLSYYLNVGLFGIFSIDQDIVQVHYNEDIQLFNKNLVDVALKAGGYVQQAKGHYLVLELAVSGAEGRFLLVTFSNPHSMVNTSEIQLSKSLGPA